MLSASGLLYNWRSRAGRSHHDPDPALDPPSYAATAGNAHARHPRRRGRRHLPDRNDPPRRPIAGQQLDARRLPSPHVSTEQESPWIENHNGGESASGIISNGGSSSTLDRLLARNSQLPGVVLQARARLEERLRGISLSGSSQTIINWGAARNEVSLGDVRAMNAVEWETENLSERFESGQFHSNLIAVTDESVLYVNRPPGLSSEAFQNLQIENFQDAVDGNNVGRAFLECSICLEKFLEGEEVIRLSCGHRFHPSCLEPWVKSCGDCPYCRTRM